MKKKITNGTEGTYLLQVNDVDLDLPEEMIVSKILVDVTKEEAIDELNNMLRRLNYDADNTDDGINDTITMVRINSFTPIPLKTEKSFKIVSL
jgi:hypothetical protein